MRILGIHSMGHDTGVALFEDDELIYAIETERLSRRKHDHRVDLAIDDLLRATGFDLADIDLVAASTNVRDGILNLRDAAQITQLVSDGTLSVATTCTLRGRTKECLVVAHEASHAILACHYADYRHPLLVLVNEGRGTFSRNSLFVFDGRSLALLERDGLPWYGTGFGWSAIGYLLGLGIGPDVAGTIMGLGGYSHPCAELADLFCLIQPDIHLQERARQEEAALALLRHPAFAPDNALGPAVIVATLQDLFSSAVVDYLARARERYGIHSLALGGGCALNIVTNSLVRDRLCADLIIPPACNDSGQALGAAIYARFVVQGGRPRQFGVFRNGVGEPTISIEATVARSGRRWRAFDASFVARRIAEGKIVGLMQGPGEIGPRALGHRSILAHPARAGMRCRVSERLKRRQWFRPLAPCMRRERFAALFPGQPSSPYMLFGYDGRALGMPEACHVDGTARIQTVDAETAPRLAALLEAFEQQTGLHGVINTSLNGQGRAIGHVAQDVFDDFLGTDLDYLVIEDVIVEMH